MTDKDIEKMFEDCGGLDMSHVKKDDILAKAKQEMYFNAESAEQKKEKSSFALFFTKKRFVSVLAGVALMFALFVGMIGLYNENFQTVYIDINPSVALKLNRFERVIGVEYLNDDAKALLSNTKLVGCDAEKAVETVISACDSAGYVKSDSQIYLSASAKEEKQSEKLLIKLKDRAENMREKKEETYAVNTYNVKKGEKKEFEKESLSPAKYNAIKEIIDEDDDFKIEDLKKKTMDELNKIKHGIKDRDDFDDERDDEDDEDDERHEPGDREHNVPEKPDDKRDDDREDKAEKNEKHMKNYGSMKNDFENDDIDDDDDDEHKNGENHGKDFGDK